MSISNVFFSVFTPVYNRKDKIHRVWESLQKQTFRNFEWIIVDDGSTDNIRPVLEEYKSTATFPVILLNQLNSGKHIAWNRAVEAASGELFVPADSDDEFIPETLEIFNKFWIQIPINDRLTFSGINVLCIDSVTKEIVGDKFPDSPFVTNNLDLRYIHKINGEKWGCIRTSCLRLRKNPEVPGGYLPETWMWFWLARRYNVLCLNIPLRVYFQNEGGNISAKKTRESYLKRLKSKNTYLTWHLSENSDYIIKYDNLKSILKSYMVLWTDSLLLKESPVTVLRKLKKVVPRLIAVLTFLPGLLYYLISPYRNK